MKRALFFLLFLLVIIALLPLFLPKTMEVSATKTIDAPIEKVYSHFNNFKKFNQWDPWTRKDSAIVLKYSSPAQGVNSYYTWESENKDLGNGKMTLKEAEQNKRIAYDLEFGEMKGNTAEAEFESTADGQTQVTWSFKSAEASYPFQVFNLLMKGAVENDLAAGLDNLETQVQNDLSSQDEEEELKAGEIKQISIDPQRMFGIEQITGNDNEEISTAMGESLGKIYSYLVDANKVNPMEMGKPTSYWVKWKGNKKHFYNGFIFNNEVKEVDDMKYIDMPAGDALTTIHMGDYKTLADSYAKLFAHAKEKGLKVSDEIWEVYLNDPENAPVEEWKTQIYLPIVE